MRRLLANPGAWLALQAVVLLVYLAGTEHLSVQRVPDSHHYENFPLWSAYEALGKTRTIGYPLFLRGVGLASSSLRYLPLCQFFVHFLAVLAFFRGLRHSGVAGRTALVVASPLLYARTVTQYGSTVLSDSLALSLAVATAGLLLTVLARPRSRPAWAGLTLTLFLTYQTRPAYVFLAGLVPLLGWLIPAVTGAPRPAPAERRVAVGLCAAALLPLLAFSTLRWAAVGHFGLVSFGGRNLIGIAGQFLQEEDVNRLSPDLADLGRAMLLERADLEARGAMKMAVYRNSVNYSLMCEMYNATTWACYFPAIVRLHPQIDDQVMFNREAARMARALILLHPKAYCSWLQQAFWEGGTYLAESAVDRWVFIRLFLLLGVLHAAGRLLRRPAAPAPPGDARLALGVMGLLGVGFALTGLVLVILVEAPIPRYMDAAGVFLPSLVSAAVCLRRAPE